MNADELVTDANVSAWATAARSPFPHMSPKDTAVWQAFLDTHLVSVQGVLYDVALGGLAVRHVAPEHELRSMWETLIRKRVDVVASVNEDVWVIEVKPLANMAALGQVLTYQFLWNAERRSDKKARAVVVCARVDEDVEAVFIHYGVSVVVVSLSDSELGAAVKAVLGPLAGAISRPPALTAQP